MSEGWVWFLLAAGLVIFQGLLAPAVAIGETLWPLPIVLFWIGMPFRWGGVQALALAALYGFVLDLIFPPLGLHTFSGLWVWAVRKTWLHVLNPRLSPEKEETFSLDGLNSPLFFAYAFPLTLWHHAWYFSLAKWRLDYEVLWAVFLSAAYTFLWEWIIFEVILRRRDAER